MFQRMHDSFHIRNLSKLFLRRIENPILLLLSKQNLFLTSSPLQRGDLWINHSPDIVRRLRTEILI